MTDETTFTLDESVRAQRALRISLGLGEEAFPLPAFIGMISDEIQQMREAGRTDQDVIDIVTATTGHAITPQDLAKYYAQPESRRG